MSKANGAMKAHEACYWLNEVMDNFRRSIEFERERAERTADYSEKPYTEEQMASNRKIAEREIAKLEKRLMALDMAASALTK